MSPGVGYHGLTAVAFSMDSHSNRFARCGCKPARVQHPAVQAHAYRCASLGSNLAPKEFQSDVLRRVVVSMVLVATGLTTKGVLRRAVRLDSEPTCRASLARVSRVHLFDRDTTHFGFVRDVLVEAVERPFMELPRSRHSVADVPQSLEGDVRTNSSAKPSNTVVRISPSSD